MTEIINKLREKLGDPQGDFVSMLSFKDNGKVEKKYYIEFAYKKKDQNGKFKTKESFMPVAITYCPFTGKKLVNAE